MNHFISEREFIKKFLQDTYVDDNITAEKTVKHVFLNILMQRRK